MKNASIKKTKYTTTKSMEKQIKFTSPIFNCGNFVTEIFAKHLTLINMCCTTTTPTPTTT